jgi:aspartyl-tRNA(Asn)/glutamyl-tRNA(Gln) amidotransferase subunit A
MNLTELTINQIKQGLKNKEFSAVDLCRNYLDKINQFNEEVAAFLTVDEKQAILEAEKIDKIISKKEKLPILAGVPCAIKDNIMVEGMSCTAGSKILEKYIAPYDATVIKKIKAQGGIILGKTNLDEFAMGSSNENSAFGPVKNPYDLERVPGGSSGGSAAALPAGFSVFSLGSDTGGSVREPAAFCGVVGLRPTYGAVSRYGLVAFASSLDQIGPITKTVEDCQTVFDVIKGEDPLDSTSQKIVEKDSIIPKKLKIGLPKEYFVKGMDYEVEKAIEKVIEKYRAIGAEIKEVSLPHSEYALACYYIISSAEASSNLARFDGIKYPPEDNPEDNLKEDLISFYLRKKGKGFGSEVKRRIMLGTYVLSSGYYQAYYLQAQKTRELLKKDFKKVFEDVDIILSPTVPFLPFKIGEKIDNPVQMYLVDIYTVSASLAGLPAVSLPAERGGNLPVGFQITGKPFKENEILSAGKLYFS